MALRGSQANCDNRHKLRHFPGFYIDVIEPNVVIGARWAAALHSDVTKISVVEIPRNNSYIMFSSLVIRIV